uniref:CCHC-type domain-containing protein n=1 Tax=Latimeria chalumnae TaxID=7897 RepID=H3A6Y4_LATCH
MEKRSDVLIELTAEESRENLQEMESTEDAGKEQEDKEGQKTSTSGKALYSEILKRKEKEKESEREKRERPSFSRIDYRRKNVVRLYYTGKIIPDRDMVGKDMIIDSLHFTPLHVFAFIHIAGTREFDISFRNVAYLDSFWARYKEVKDDLLWKDFEVIKISESATRQVTILFKSELVPASDISFWLKRHCEEVGFLKPIHDRNGFWIGGYKVLVKLYITDAGLVHLPNFITIGRDRRFLFYPGQPSVCHKCGLGRHFGTNCTKLFCSRCGLSGHLAKDCKSEIKCNLCNQTGHLYINCPKSEKNGLPEALWSGLSVEEQMDAEAEALEEQTVDERVIVTEEGDIGSKKKVPFVTIPEENIVKQKQDEFDKIKKKSENGVSPVLAGISNSEKNGGSGDVGGLRGSDVPEEEVIASGSNSAWRKVSESEEFNRTMGEPGESVENAGNNKKNEGLGELEDSEARQEEGKTDKDKII